MRRSIFAKGRRLPLTAIGLCLALAGVAPAAHASDGTATVRNLYDTLMSAMRNGASLGASGRYQQIEPVVSRVFDVPLMARLAVGSQWVSLTESQRQQITQAFTRYIAAIYAERFDSYSGERLQVTGVRPSAGGSIITSQIVKSNGEPVDINYLMRNNGGTWQIADVYLDGTISELATRRSEFASILRSRGVEGLIQSLNTKAASLTRAS